jgi:carboxymethylenebutenolidase
MCFDHDSRPPALPDDLFRAPIAGGAGAEPLELTSADGTRFSAALAESASPGGAAVVVLPDVRGLYRFYVELAERFAEAGHHAIAIDYFGRTAGVGERGEDFEYMPHVQQTNVDRIQEDIATAMATLRERTDAARIATVGFCFGGSQSFYAGENAGLGLDRVVGFYGGLKERPGRPPGRDEAAKMAVPVLALFGGADESIPPEHREIFERNLERAGVEHEIVVYPGAPHSFFDRKQDEWAEASADAWRRTLAFLATP